MSKNVSLAADESREVGAMFIDDWNASQALECVWMLSGKGLACKWTESRRAADSRKQAEEPMQSKDRRVA